MSKTSFFKYLRYLFTLVLIGVLAYFCKPDQIWSALQQASLPLLASYGVFGVIAAVFGGLALLVLFDFSRKRGWQLRFLSDYLYVQGISQFTPAQLGELTLPFLAARQRFQQNEIAAALVIQRISALLIVALLALFGAGQWATSAYLWAASIIVCGACGVVLFVMLRHDKAESRDRDAWFGIAARLEGFLGASRAMLVRRGDRLAWHVVLMLVRYAASVLGNFALLAAFDIKVPFLDLAAITALAILSNLVPITIGGIGLTEGVFAMALKSYGYATGLTITAVLSGRVVNAILALGWVVLHHSLPRQPRDARELRTS